MPQQEYAILISGLIGMLLGMSGALGTDDRVAYLALNPVPANVLLIVLTVFVFKESPK